MRKLTCTLLGAALAGVAPAALAADKPVVAVLPFGSPTKYSEMGDNAQPTFITELVKSKKVRVVDEKRASDAVKRFEREMTGLYDSAKIKQIGRFLKADYVVSGMIAYTGDAFTMTVHFTNVETLELEMAEDVDFRDVGKMRVAVRTLAKKAAAMAVGEEAKKGRHEAFLNVDGRSFHDAAEACIAALTRLDGWRYEGEVDQELDGKKVHVKLRHGAPPPGMPLQVYEEGLGENDKPIGVVYVEEPDERGGGFVARWIKEQDPEKKKRGDFGLGTRVSNARYKYRIAVGELVDEAEDNEDLVKMFKDKLLETLEESDRFVAKADDEVVDLAGELGRGSKKTKALEKLHAAGVDFVIVGKFVGSPGSRRADFKVLSTVTGKVWQSLKFETRI
jgi:TolB-like protein